jgi:hypothetical protein
MTDLDQLFGAQQRNLRASYEKAEQDREMQRLADDAAPPPSMLAKRHKRREQRKRRAELKRAGQGTQRAERGTA